jgi:hypothetical protein
MERVDFHAHADPLSLESGKNVVDMATKSELMAVAIFAKEQVLPYYDELIDYGKSRGVNVITGSETLTMHMNCGVETVSLGFDHNEMMRINGFNHREDNIAIARLQIEFLKEHDLEVGSYDEQSRKLLNLILDGKITEKAIRLCELVANNPNMDNNIKTVLDENMGCFSNSLLNKLSEMYHGDKNRIRAKLLYILYFDVGKDGFQFVNKNYQRKHYTMEEHIDAVHKGVGAVLYSPEGKFNFEIWNSLLSLKIDGIMAFHAGKLGCNDNIPDVPISVIKDCVARDLLVLGGSDYSGRNWKLGTGDNEKMYMSTRRLTDLNDRLSYIRNQFA